MTRAAWRPQAAILGAVALGVGFLLLALPYVTPGTDASYAIAWGDRLAHGDPPEFDHSLPVKHPLELLVATALSLVAGDAALELYSAVSVAAFVALLYAVFRLGRAIWSAAAGLLAAALLVVGGPLIGFAASCFPDVPFAALVVLATSLAIEDTERHWRRVLVLLALAGLLRPEAWALSVAYGAWLIYGTWPSPSPVRVNPRLVAALAVSAPVAWALFDLLVTGDPLDTVRSLGTGRAPDTSGALAAAGLYAQVRLDEVGRGIDDLIGWPVAALAAAVAAYSLWRLRGSAPERVDPVAGVSAAALVLLVTQAGLAIFGVATPVRFLVALAALACVLAVTTLAIWRSPPVGVALAVAGVVLAVTLPGNVSEIADALELHHGRHKTNSHLLDLAGATEVRAAADDCTRVVVVAAESTHASGVGPPLVALRLDRDPGTIGERAKSRLGRGEAAFLWRKPPPRQSSFKDRRGPWRFASRC
jgi:hypothetical protein